MGKWWWFGMFQPDDDNFLRIRRLNYLQESEGLVREGTEVGGIARLKWLLWRVRMTAD